MLEPEEKGATWLIRVMLEVVGKETQDRPLQEFCKEAINKLDEMIEKNELKENY